jgi:hypothetical protein
LILQAWQHYIGLEPGRQRTATVMQATTHYKEEYTKQHTV